MISLVPMLQAIKIWMVGRLGTSLGHDTIGATKFMKCFILQLLSCCHSYSSYIYSKRRRLGTKLQVHTSVQLILCNI